MRTGAVVVLLLLMAVPVRAADPPPDLQALYEFGPAPGAAIPFAEEKRHSAMRLAALGFGARAGLARRSWEIGVMLERLSAPLSAIYRFGDLMLTGQGFTVLPPVLAETRQAFRLGLGQDRAASARRVLRIVEPERIVSAAPHWRDYLVRSWRTARPAGRGAVSAYRSRDHAVAAMAGRGLGARNGARRRYLRRRSRPAEPDFRGRRPLAPPASRRRWSRSPD